MGQPCVFAGRQSSAGQALEDAFCSLGLLVAQILHAWLPSSTGERLTQMIDSLGMLLFLLINISIIDLSHGGLNCQSLWKGLPFPS